MTQIHTATPQTIRADRAVFRPPVWWGPIAAGAVSAIAIQFFFTVLGIAIGVSVSGDVGGVEEGIGMAAGAWWLITGTLSLMIGGLVVGMLMGRADSSVLALHAVAMWALVALFGFVVIWSGAGLATDAASPLAAIAAERTDVGLPILGGESTSNPAGTGARSFENDPVAEQARDIAQASAWWSVVGLLLGVAASVGGAVLGERRWRHPD